MYVRPNFKTKRDLKAAVAAWRVGGPPVEAFQPGPFGPAVADGRHGAEGPHYPDPHRWYAAVEVKNGIVVKVIG
jgi:hypothetical protein